MNQLIQEKKELKAKSHFSKRKENFANSKQENNQSSSNKPRKKSVLKVERTNGSPQMKGETKMERIERKINKLKQILESPQTQQKRKH